MAERRWIQNGTEYRPSYIDDDPPEEIEEIARMIDVLCDKAKELNIMVSVNGTPLTRQNCKYTFPAQRTRVG